MNQDTRDYLNNELHFFEKAYEIQFTHFMGVFYQYLRQFGNRTFLPPYMVVFQKLTLHI